MTDIKNVNFAKWLNSILIGIVGFFSISTFNDLKSVQSTQVKVLQEITRAQAIDGELFRRLERLEKTVDKLELTIDRSIKNK